MAPGSRLRCWPCTTSLTEVVSLHALSLCSPLSHLHYQLKLSYSLGIPVCRCDAGVSPALPPCTARQELLACPGPPPQRAEEVGT